MSRRVLFSWVGATDLRCARGEQDGDGPLAQALLSRAFDVVHVLTNPGGPNPQYSAENHTHYKAWLEGKLGSSSPALRWHESTVGAMDYKEVWADVTGLLDEHYREDDTVTFHTSPGSPAMQQTWVLLAKTRYPAKLISSWFRNGRGEVNDIDVPFDLALEVRELVGRRDQRLVRLASDVRAAFSKVETRSQKMLAAMDFAGRVAMSDEPVIIHGDTGTGKELFADAIFKASRRKHRPFRAINCGALPPTLLGSQLFGHVKGSFTGATTDRPGFFQAANHGTLFLDEVGELTQDAQVRLLRVLQNNELYRVGSVEPEKVDVRIIAASHKDLRDEVEAGRFREDLYYRLAVAVVEIPSLAERGRRDIKLLSEFFLQKVNEKQHRSLTFSVNALEELQRYAWPGNVRELQNTISRAALKATSDKINKGDLEFRAPRTKGSGDGVLGRALGADFDIEEVLKEVRVHYLERAAKECKSKSQAARDLGLKSHQVFSSWLERDGLEWGA